LIKPTARNRCGKIANHRLVTVKKMGFGAMKSVVAVITMIGNSDSKHVENDYNKVYVVVIDNCKKEIDNNVLFFQQRLTIIM